MPEVGGVCGGWCHGRGRDASTLLLSNGGRGSKQRSPGYSEPHSQEGQLPLRGGDGHDARLLSLILSHWAKREVGLEVFSANAPPIAVLPMWEALLNDIMFLDSEITK